MTDTIAGKPGPGVTTTGPSGHSLARELDALVSAFNRRAWPEALQLSGQLLNTGAGVRQSTVHYVAGVANLELQRMPQALQCLREATRLEPDRSDFSVQYAKALSQVRHDRDARTEADRAHALGPSDPVTLDTLGVVYTRLGARELAVELFAKACAAAPHIPLYRYNLAVALMTAGRIAESEESMEQCIALDPHHWSAHFMLAQLRRQTPDSNHVERLLALVDSVPPNSDRQAMVCLNMALAKELEDLGDYPRSLSHLTAGKRASGVHRRYSFKQDEELFEALTERFPTTSTAAEGLPTEEPIFIIGMPRSGTTLVERIISSHPSVYSAGELMNFGMALKFLAQSPSRRLVDPETVRRTEGVDMKLLGQTYLASTRPVTGHLPRFIDKLPHNFLYVGFIAQALPRAKIICLRRNPMDTCLSNFRQLFSLESSYFDYSFNLMDTGRYFVLFDRLMAYWNKMFPGRILEMQYEDLVENQEPCSRRLIEFCDLPWDPACLRFHENKSSVATASAVQVRSPMYRTALERWRAYGDALDPLRDLLRSSGIDIE
ncbi:tetratricopeptide repeat-containing sulfotransferase family protein [Dyella sp. A6]|uniref:tetratricopeptide repeat-containing sulfotransferase family protein n=1 Tax=Dyella aluminiiresistens TaxID=3069105 RepID=UPI002E799BDC|nr:sulfotransferase [Dyella sp. A6]